ncbi:MAG: CocE/NonD family hydrolase [Proteobacteria bacterium]|nr:CocE/NonD family hydrolase [Pseudomonadota bacterium]
MKRFVLAMGFVVVAACLSQVSHAGEMTKDGQNHILKILDGINWAGFEDAIIQFNLRIKIPEQQGLSPVDLWGTLIKHQGDGKWPTIVISTPYRREYFFIIGLSLFTHGYNILAVDTRGTGSAGGDWISFGPEEHTDLAFVIDDWIPKHDWSDGNVGLIGPSYMAICQLMAAGQVKCDEKTGEPLHLRALFPFSSMSDAYKDIIMHGGNLNMVFVPIWLGFVDSLALFPSTLWWGGENDGMDGTWEDPDTDVIKEAGKNWMDSWNQIPGHMEWFTDADKIVDGPFFDERSPMTYWPDKNSEERDSFGAEKTMSSKLPVFLVGGWLDVFTRGTLNNYQYGLKNQDVSDKAIIMGPWYHIDASAALGLDSVLLTNEVSARWFDWKVKGIEDPFMVEFPAMIYVMGKEKWRLEKSWPLAESRVDEKVLYLSKKKATINWLDWFSLFNMRKNYQLVEEATYRDYKNDDPVLIHNPAELHGTLSRSTQRWLLGGIANITQLAKFLFNIDIDCSLPWEDERADEIACLTFTTGKLETDLEITGPLKLTFWARSEFDEPVSHSYIDKLEANIYDKMIQIPLAEDNSFIEILMDVKDVQWVIEVNDVYPLGRAKNITSGWLSAAHRPYDSNEDPNTVEHYVDPDYVPFDPFYDKADREPMLINEGDLYQYVVEIWPTSNVFKKGHRIRLSISASDFPHLVPLMVPSENTVVIDEDHPAMLAFNSVNTDDEGNTWMWVSDTGYKNADEYLKYHTN